MPLALFAVQLLLHFSLTLQNQPAPVVALGFFVAAALPIAFAWVVPLVGVRLSVEPALLAIWNWIYYLAGMPCFLLGFSLSVMCLSLTPFLIGVLIGGSWWVFAWPRRGRWRQWQARAAARAVPPDLRPLT
jgi:hypothetical protein